MIRDPVDEWRELSALYEQADELEPAALRDWLAALRAQGHPLLAPLERMLDARAAVRDGDFLGALPAVADTEAEPAAVHGGEGTRIGAYRLLRHIGRGGMAEVWLAKRDDGAFERQVAIKLLFRHAASTERAALAQRFARERDILASLHHPNIAALHDAGVTPDGQPWLALEYVEGEPITGWCDRRRLDVPARVRLFRQVLLAVQHAHANLVIHRDLKPANILVTDAGEVRLLDFGIAKLQEVGESALEETELTRQTGRPLTLQYASPEQILGKPLTTACDVYALGVVLYELLCGERPYEVRHASAAEIERAILELEPRAPSRRRLTDDAALARSTQPKAWRRLLMDDLDAVVLKALAKRSDGRYASVESWRLDLERWLEGRPVGARAPSRLRAIAKFARRHRLGVALGTLAVTSLLVASATALMFGLRAKTEAATALASRQFLVDLLQTADPNQTRGPQLSLLHTLAQGRSRAQSTLRAQPAVQAQVLLEIAKVQRRLGDFANAVDSVRGGIDALERVHDEGSLAAARTELADLLSLQGQPGEALQILDGVRATVAASDPSRRARFSQIRGNVLAAAGRLSEARDELSRGLRFAVESFGPGDLRSVDFLRALADVDASRGDYANARSEIGAAQARLDAIVQAPPMDVLGITVERANIEHRAGNVAEVLRIVRAAEPACESTLGPQNETCWLLSYMHAQSALRSRDLQDLGRHMGPVLLNARASGLRQRDTALLMAYRGLAALERLGEHDDIARQVEAMASVDGAGDWRRTEARLAMAEGFLFRHDGARAQRWASAALEAADAPVPTLPRWPQARAHVLLGIAHQLQGRHADALHEFEQAGDILRRLGPDDPVTLLYSANRAASLIATGRSDAAGDLLDQVRATLAPRFGSDAPVLRQMDAMLAGMRSRRPVAPSATMFFT